MKRMLVFTVALLMGAAVFAQDYQLNGKEFSSVKKERTKSESADKKTGYTWKNSKGKVYDIYITPRGACYIICVSSKTGKEYKSYLPKEVAAEIKKEMK